MDESTTAFLLKIAPNQIKARWDQRSLKQTLDEWADEKHDAYETLLLHEDCTDAIQYVISPHQMGKHGYDSDFEFVPNLNPHYLVEAEHPEELCHNFYSDWIANLQSLIEEEVETSTLSPTELASYFGNQNPRAGEHQVSDALGVTVGNYRGKVGRVREKVESASITNRLTFPADREEEREWGNDTYDAGFHAIDFENRSTLPIDNSDGVYGPQWGQPLDDGEE